MNNMIVVNINKGAGCGVCGIAVARNRYIAMIASEMPSEMRREHAV